MRVAKWTAPGAAESVDDRARIERAGARSSGARVIDGSSMGARRRGWRVTPLAHWTRIVLVVACAIALAPPATALAPPGPPAPHQRVTRPRAPETRKSRRPARRPASPRPRALGSTPARPSRAPLGIPPAPAAE